MVLERTISISKLKRDEDLLHKSHQIIGYANDLVVVARNEEEVKDITQRLIEEAWRRGLRVNEKNSNIMKIKKIKKDRAEFRVCTCLEEMNFKEVDQFV